MTRPPIVVVLGHVDHGKSSLLEAIKDFKITAKESGGITQHIGGYEVEHSGKKITFIDTPGHEAFSAMRSRGAKVADIAILVVAADEGVQPQTKEAVLHIKKSGIPMIVAINKMDKPGADSGKIKRELVKNEVLVESMGGKIPAVETSARTKQGITELLEVILLVAEMEDLKSAAQGPTEGVVIEAYLDAQRGPTATLLFRNGTLKPGDIIGTASTIGKVKILEDFQGHQIEKAFPSMPAIVLGWEDVPQLGEKFKVFNDVESAKGYVEKKERKAEVREVVISEPGVRILNLIIKADVSGSLEAIDEVVKGLPQEKVSLRILKKEAGEVGESDVKLAQSSQATILAFRVKVSLRARKLSQTARVRIITFDIIYDLSQGIRQVMEKMTASEVKRIELGRMKALVLFWSEKNRQIVGARVLEGEIKKGTSLEVWRQETLAGRGRMISLQRDKKDIDIARKGDEIGILYEGDTKIEERDIIVVFTHETVKT